MTFGDKWNRFIMLKTVFHSVAQVTFLFQVICIMNKKKTEFPVYFIIKYLT